MKRALTTVLALLLFAGVYACERSADTDSPKTFENEAVKFQYPGNWTATAQKVDGGTEIQVESPGDAIVIVLVMDDKLMVGLDAFAHSMVEVRAEEAERLLSPGEVALGSVGETVSKEVTTTWSDGRKRAIEQRFTITALGEPVPHVALFHELESRDRTTFVMSQVAAEDMEKVKPGFQQVWSSISLK